MKVIHSIKTMFEKQFDLVKLETVQACFIEGKEYITLQFEGVPEIKIDYKSCIALCKDVIKSKITKDEINELVDKYIIEDKENIEKSTLPDKVKRNMILNLGTKEKKKSLKNAAIENLLYEKSKNHGYNMMKSFVKKMSDIIINEYAEFLK